MKSIELDQGAWKISMLENTYLLWKELFVKKLFENLMQNDLFVLLMFGVFAYIAFSAVVIAVLQVPSEALLNSGLKEILLVFEGWTLFSGFATG